MKVLHQISLLQSLMQGNFNGVLKVSELQDFGDTGIGTFEAINGEMILLDGTAYQALADGTVAIADAAEKVIFSNLSRFCPDYTFRISMASDSKDLERQLNDKLLCHGRNQFYMIRLEGYFPKIRVRSEFPQRGEHGALLEVMKTAQVAFDYENLSGTLIGLFCPSFVKGWNTVGWHYHFLSEDQTRGGHVLELQLEDVTVKAEGLQEFCIHLPEGKDFQEMDLEEDQHEKIMELEAGKV